ncbi:MAG TPA: DUF2892 domain-containing protein [Nitrospiria bacterium]|nr:DUF2892 domain-containing protein [Nitrospiria bacterium]
MRCNIGSTERTIRIVLGILLLVIGYAAGLPVWASVVAYMAGAIALLTGAVRFCPLWQLFGINTCGPSLHASKMKGT